MTSPSLATIVRRALAGEASVPKGGLILVAVSGGPDSMALLDVLARLAAKSASRLRLRAHGVDHGLRDEAARELDLAERHASLLGVGFDRTRVSVARGSNLQARARTARWEALVAAARLHGASAVATGHHAEDRAETVLLRLLRGAGLRGLAVLEPRATAAAGGADDVTVIRPLLRARRDDIRAHLARRRIPCAHDPSNVDPRYLRTRVRAELIPLLSALDPGIVGHLGDLADELTALRRLRRADAEMPRVIPNAVPLWAAGLPRATQAAIGALLRSRSRSARVWLPGGLTLMADVPDAAEPENPPRRPRTRKPRG